jgi:hypothetical protein
MNINKLPTINRETLGLVKNELKLLVDKLLNPFDLKLVRASTNRTIDLTGLNVPPQSSQYYAGLNPIIINVDLTDGCTNRWFDLSSESLDPAIFAIRTSLDFGLSGKDLYENVLSTLKEHKSLTGCKNAAEKLGIDTEATLLSEYPAWAAVNPWDSQNMKENFIQFPHAVKRNRSANGLSIETNDPEEIMRIDQDLSLPSHAMQYSTLTEKIKKNGLRYGDRYGYVTAEILVKNDKVRWKPGGEGNHRAAVAAALGYESIPVLVTKVIHAGDIKFWPNVLNGSFSESSAKIIFENIFNAKPPDFQDGWIQKIKHGRVAE